MSLEQDDSDKPAQAHDSGIGDHADNKKQGEADEKKDSNEPENEDTDKDGSKKPRSKKPLIILVIVVVLLAVIGFFVWFAHRNQVSTDDAYTDGNVVSMVPKISGYVVELYVDDNSRVRKGDLLLRIDPRDYLIAKEQAEAQLAQAKAQHRSSQSALRVARVQYPAQLESAKAQQQAAVATLAQAQAAYSRQHEVDPRATTQDTIDASTSQQLSSSANLKSAKAQVTIASLIPEQLQQVGSSVDERSASVQQAQAQLDQANLNLSYTEVRAPSDGFITKRNVQPGTFLAAGDVMFLLVTPDVWITANFKESQMGRMRPGDAVDIEVDAYSGYKLEGHVQSIQYGSGARFSAFPAENATGNFVKIVQRIPVKIVIDRGLDANAPLPLGLSVSPIVHFR
jgi:membrane fusion protein (multidrug efflux system)